MGMRNTFPVLSVKNASAVNSGAALYFPNSTPIDQVQRTAGARMNQSKLGNVAAPSYGQLPNVYQDSGGLWHNLNHPQTHEWDIWANPTENNSNVYFGDVVDSLGDKLLYNQNYKWTGLAHASLRVSWKTGSPARVITVRRGDWIELKTGRIEPDYGVWVGSSSSSGYHITAVKFGSYRCGNSFLINNVIVGRVEQGLGGVGPGIAAGFNTTYIRVPYGAKSGFLHITTNKGVVSWSGVRQHKQTGRIEDQVNVPILVAGDVSPICIDAFQHGMNNVDSEQFRGNVETMVNPHGATTQNCQSPNIGSSVLNYGPTYRGHETKAGGYYPMGFTAAGVYHMCAFVKEMRFRVSMMANAANYGSTFSLIDNMLMGAATVAWSPAGAFVGNMAIGLMSIMHGMILHELGQASGGSSIVRVHRMDTMSNSPGSGEQDITQGDSCTNVTHTMVVSTKARGSAVSAYMIIDWSRMRFMPNNPLHESISQTSTTADILDCSKTIPFLDRDGNIYKREKVCIGSQWNPTACDPGYGRDGNSYECKHADYDGYWKHTSGGKAGQAVSICDDDSYPNAAGECPDWDGDGSPDVPKNRYTLVDGPAEWQYPHLRTDINGGPPKKRFINGMSPLTSPPPFKHTIYDAHTIMYKGTDNPFKTRPGWRDQQNFDLFRSEGLACGGTLFFPWFKALAIGKGQLTNVSAQMYTEDSKCLTCSARDWGKDARYCMSNDNALGYGGWALGLKTDPSFWLGGKSLHADTIAYTAFPARMGSWSIYDKDNKAGLALLKGHFKQQDIDRHDQSKMTAGSHFGGFTENILQSAASYERQAGSGCKSFAYPTAGKLKDHKIVEGYTTEGHGYEFWEAGYIPTYAKNDISTRDVYLGNANKWDKMRNNGRMQVTERIDQITIIGVVHNFLSKAAPETIQAVDPEHYHFSPGDFIAIRAFPTTTSTTTPRHSVLVRKFNDFLPRGMAGGAMVDVTAGYDSILLKMGYGAAGGISRVGMWSVGAQWPIIKSMRSYPTGRQGAMPSTWVGKDRVHPSSSIIGIAGTIMCSDSGTWGKGNALWQRRAGKGANEIIHWNDTAGASPVTNFSKLNQISIGRAWYAWGISLGDIVDNGGGFLGMSSVPYLTPWCKGYLVQGGLTRPQFEGSFFKFLVDAKWGRNGRACFTHIKDDQTIYVRIPPSATKINVNSQGGVSGGSVTSEYIWLYFEEPSAWHTEFIGAAAQAARAAKGGGNHGSYPLSVNIQIPQVCRVHSASQEAFENATSHIERKI